MIRHMCNVFCNLLDIRQFLSIFIIIDINKNHVPIISLIHTFKPKLNTTEIESVAFYFLIITGGSGSFGNGIKISISIYVLNKNEKSCQKDRKSSKGEHRISGRGGGLKKHKKISPAPPAPYLSSLKCFFSKGFRKISSTQR